MVYRNLYWVVKESVKTLLGPVLLVPVRQWLWRSPLVEWVGLVLVPWATILLPLAVHCATAAQPLVRVCAVGQFWLPLWHSNVIWFPLPLYSPGNQLECCGLKGNESGKSFESVLQVNIIDLLLTPPLHTSLGVPLLALREVPGRWLSQIIRILRRESLS